VGHYVEKEFSKEIPLSFLPSFFFLFSRSFRRSFSFFLSPNESDKMHGFEWRGWNRVKKKKVEKEQK
jgi:hypothetical protein